MLLAYDVRDDERDAAVEEDQEGDAEERDAQQVRRRLEARRGELRKEACHCCCHSGVSYAFQMQRRRDTTQLLVLVLLFVDK